MSLECSECENSLRVGHAVGCSRAKTKEANMSGRPSDSIAVIVNEMLTPLWPSDGVRVFGNEEAIKHWADRLAALAPVTPAGSQAVKSAAGQLPEGAIAWLDMGKGEAELLFTKKGNSNRANSRQLMALFKTVSPGWHPLYLHPVTPASGAVDDGMVERYCDAVAEYLGSLDEAQWAKHRKDRAVSLRRVARVGLAAALTHSTEEPQP